MLSATFCQPQWLIWNDDQEVIGPATFHGDWFWNIFYGHSLPCPDSRRAVVSFWAVANECAQYWLTAWWLSLPWKSVIRHLPLVLYHCQFVISCFYFLYFQVTLTSQKLSSQRISSADTWSSVNVFLSWYLIVNRSYHVNLFFQLILVYWQKLSSKSISSADIWLSAEVTMSMYFFSWYLVISRSYHVNVFLQLIFGYQQKLLCQHTSSADTWLSAEVIMSTYIFSWYLVINRSYHVNLGLQLILGYRQKLCQPVSLVTWLLMKVIMSTYVFSWYFVINRSYHSSILLQLILGYWQKFLCQSISSAATWLSSKVITSTYFFSWYLVINRSYHINIDISYEVNLLPQLILGYCDKIQDCKFVTLGLGWNGIAI